VIRLSIIVCFVFACGSPAVSQKVLPPNVEQACDRAISCGVFLDDQKPECLACVEKLAEQINDAVKEQIPPLEQIDCKTISKYAHDTLVSECVVRRSFGP